MLSLKKPIENINKDKSKIIKQDTIFFDGYIIKDTFCTSSKGVHAFNFNFKPLYADSIYLDDLNSNIRDSFINAKIVNATRDTFYFYSEILNQKIVFRPFTHRVDTVSKRYYFSLLPRRGEIIGGFAHTKYNRFIKLPPQSFYNIRIKNQPEYYAERYTGVHYQDPYDFDKPSKSSLFYLDYAIKNYKIYFQVAVYPSVMLLCEYRSTSNPKYWELFHTQEKSFFILNGRMKNFSKNWK